MIGTLNQLSGYQVFRFKPNKLNYLPPFSSFTRNRFSLYLKGLEESRKKNVFLEVLMVFDCPEGSKK